MLGTGKGLHCPRCIREDSASESLQTYGAWGQYVDRLFCARCGTWYMLIQMPEPPGGYQGGYRKSLGVRGPGENPSEAAGDGVD
jgi:hypothetical protein